MTKKKGKKIKKKKVKVLKVIPTKEILGEVSKAKLKQLREKQEEITGKARAGGLFFKKNEQ